MAFGVHCGMQCSFCNCSGISGCVWCSGKEAQSRRS